MERRYVFMKNSDEKRKYNDMTPFEHANFTRGLHEFLLARYTTCNCGECNQPFPCSELTPILQGFALCNNCLKNETN